MNAIYKKQLSILLFLSIAGVFVFRAEMLWGAEGQNKGVPLQGQPRRAPAIYNESVVTGEVLGFGIISSSLLDIRPPMTIYKLEILVKISEEVEGMRSFTREKVGTLIQAYSKERIPAELFSKAVKVRVSYSGDERGGMFWIKNIESLETKERNAP